ncbi:hypothetical protein FAZ69_28035 [Trinickia terrae]|uniref:Lysine-specific metallo-endopeptidase domain-containing protein n=1 Tax=Trinickia terrae TaxID=2571161 RepID=A0A4U1HJZ9_9BURK|nr:M35 family metallo-endopeptidase [Trinickia terrae]TKC81472.1 hypothetical protein FAZ69_28035 [Trinickia terrae]
MLTVNFLGFSEDQKGREQKNHIAEALKIASTWADKVNTAYLNWNLNANSDAKFAALAEQWFDLKNDQGRRKILASMVRRMAVYFQSDRTLNLRYGGISSDDPDDLAETAFQSGEITLFAPFFDAEMTGTDSAPGTLLHELTHQIQNTEDFAYGTDDSIDLALDEPFDAARNADNFEYLYEGYCS